METACCLLVLIGLLVTLVAVPVSVASDGWRARAVWGSIVRRARVGDGAFRTAVTETRSPRGVPALVWAAGVPGAALAPLTGLVFAPAGLLGGLVLFGGGASFTASVTLGAALSGFVLPFALYRASRAVQLCEWGARGRARAAASWSAVHHGMLVVAFGLELVQKGDPAWWYALAPSLVGLAHALVLLAAGEQVERIQRSMSEDERATLARVHAQLARREAPEPAPEPPS